jgi:hypothetical protein
VFSSQEFEGPIGESGADRIQTEPLFKHVLFCASADHIIDGPGQENMDIALSRSLAVGRPTEKSTMNLRAEFYNALNIAQCSDPDTNFSSPTFGSFSTTSVNSRVGQPAVKLAF